MNVSQPMQVPRFALFTLFGLLAFVAGYQLFPAGSAMWGYLLETIAWPESRWGPERSRWIGEALRPLSYFVLTLIVSIILTMLAGSRAFTVSLFCSAGALTYFVLPVATGYIPVGALRAFTIPLLACVILVPAFTFILVRAGWLTPRRTRTRA